MDATSVRGMEQLVHLDVARGFVVGDVHLPPTCKSICLGDWFPNSVQPGVQLVDVSRSMFDDDDTDLVSTFPPFHIKRLFPNIVSLNVGAHDAFFMHGHYPNTLRVLLMTAVGTTTPNLYPRMPQLHSLICEFFDGAIHACIHPFISTLCCTHTCQDAAHICPSHASFQVAFPSLSTLLCTIRFWGVQHNEQWLTVYDTHDTTLVGPEPVLDCNVVTSLLLPCCRTFKVCHILLHAPLHVCEVRAPVAYTASNCDTHLQFEVYVQDCGHTMFRVVYNGTSVFGGLGLHGFEERWPHPSLHRRVLELLTS
jgi:hypothetical protein